MSTLLLPDFEKQKPEKHKFEKHKLERHKLEQEKFETQTLAESPRKQRRVFYPVEDGKPMAEGPKHVDNIIDTVHALRTFLSKRKNVYLGVNGFVFWQKGKGRARLAPDIYVVYEVNPIVNENKPNSWKSWEQNGRVPSIVFEFTSESTMKEDCGRKYTIYENILKVEEYIRFDPIGNMLNPSLQCDRLENGVYVPIKPTAEGIYSSVLGLYLRVMDGALRLYDPVEKRLLPTILESEQRAVREEKRAQEALFRAEMELRRANVETRRANVEARRANIEEQRADEEAKRADNATRENAFLKEELEKLRKLLEKQ